MLKLEDADATLAADFFTQLQGLDAQKDTVHKSATAELGSTLSAGGATAEDKIEQHVKGLVSKSTTGLTYAQAYTQFITSDEGQKMYSEYKNARQGGI